jgi:flagellar basal-body rod modification protein FlgD
MQVTTTTGATTSQLAATATAPTSTDTTASAGAPTLNYDAFLQLLIAELKNQDPTKPVDSAQYIGQLASFSSVEQAVKTNAKLDSLMSASALSQAEAFIGRTVASSDGSITGQIVAVKVTSDGPLAYLDNGQQVLLGPGITVG